MTSVPGFLTKTFEIFSSPEYSDCCGWGPNGDTIIIRKIEQFSKQILPKYFKHSNFQSFVRQLNMYDFHKTVQDPNHGEFQHQYFRQNQPELLIYIKRKANNRGTETLKKFSTAGKSSSSNPVPPPPLPAPSSRALLTSGEVHDLPMDSSFLPEPLTKLLPEELVQETDSVFQELEQQKLMREEFEKRMEDKLSKVEGENQMLKRLFFESHQKNLVLQERMEKVLKTLYSVFVGGQAGKALTSGRMPSMLLTDYPSPAQPLRIMDKDSSDSKALDADIDLSSFSRLPSIEYANPVGSANNFENYTALKNSLAGKELSRVTQGTSFDCAAASVAPPLKYLASFDSTYFPNDSLLDDSLGKGDEQYHSDRVTLLSESNDSPRKDGKSSGQSKPKAPPRSSSRSKKSNSSRASESNLSQYQPDSQRVGANGHGTKRTFYSDSDLAENTGMNPDFFLEDHKRRKLEENIDAIAKIPTSQLLNTGEPYEEPSGQADKNQPLGGPMPEDIQFMDLLNRNQDSTLTRLDSLEQTIATLLEGIDEDDEIIEDPGLPSSESANLPAVPLPDGVVPSNPPAPSRADS